MHVAAAVNFIGAKGAKALSDALAPRQNPDGSWACNTALNALMLESNAIRDAGAQALAEAMAPREGPDGTWKQTNALSTLELKSEPRDHVPFPRPSPLLVLSLGFLTEGAVVIIVLWSLAHFGYCVLVASSASVTKIGDVGATALADALAPRKNPDGTWSYSSTLTTLDLRSESFLPPSFL